MKRKLVLATLLFIIVPCLTFALQAQAQTDDLFGLNAAANIGLPNTSQDPKDAAVNIVRYLMGFIGIIAVIVIIWGGFQWLIAGGNEDKVGSAKRTIISGIIGLIIVIAAFAIVTIVFGFTQNVIGGGA